MPTENEVELAELISKIIPFAEMTRIVNTGAEATMNAIRLARAFTKRRTLSNLIYAITEHMTVYLSTPVKHIEEFLRLKEVSTVGFMKR